MKLKKVVLILGISICIVAGQIQTTFGLEQDNAVEQHGAEHTDGQSDEEKDKDKDKDKKDENQETETENTDQTNPEDESMGEKPGDGKPDGEQGGTEKPDDGKTDEEQGGTEKPDDGKTDEEQGGTEKPDDGKPDGEQGGTEKPDDGKTDEDKGESEKPDDGKPDGEQDGTEKPNDGNTDGSQDEVEKPDDGNTDGDQNEAEKPDDGNTDNGVTDDVQPDDGGSNEPVQTPPSDNGGASDDSYYETAGGGTYEESTVNSYSASIRFLDDSEKIKYNVSVPIEGLPSFITQEMIVAALKCQDETGYPASVTIAQIIQESGFGQYGPGGEDGKGLSYLAYQYNNLFGIKGTGPAGSVDMITGEQSKDGSLYTIVSGFRVYDTYTECIEDRTDLLKEVYLDLTLGVTDANTFAMKIGSRWATSLTYGQSLIRQMEQYDLYRLDNMTLGEFSNMLGTFVNPCPGALLSSDFGSREEPIAGAGTYHKGIDLGTGTYNIPTYAAASGTVTFAGEAGTAGNMVIIDHGNGLVTKYMHHEKVFVEEGQKVEKGQQIGLSGTTGQSTGNHLHFQVEEHGTAVDPLQYFTEKQQDSFFK